MANPHTIYKRSRAIYKRKRVTKTLSIGKMCNNSKEKRREVMPHRLPQCDNVTLTNSKSNHLKIKYPPGTHGHAILLKVHKSTIHHISDR